MQTKQLKYGKYKLQRRNNEWHSQINNGNILKI